MKLGMCLYEKEKTEVREKVCYICWIKEKMSDSYTEKERKQSSGKENCPARE